MKILVNVLIYGGKPLNLTTRNLQVAGYPHKVRYINIHGLDRALNAGLIAGMENGADAVMFLANDIVEPAEWLARRVEVMESDPQVGIVSIPVNEQREQPGNEDLIGNYLIRREVIEAIGAFNPAFYPYGPLDLDYCIRSRKAGFKTVYVPHETAFHPHPHGGEDPLKQELVNRFWPIHERNASAYMSGEKDILIPLDETTVHES